MKENNEKRISNQFGAFLHPCSQKRSKKYSQGICKSEKTRGIVRQLNARPSFAVIGKR